ncbi:hypothetical protein SDC9_149091 [bioreactor metagenome]|jgi:hypothetical protein|uniref:Uncharacterized protein n=1 Tax=bioreactor metagenome TaxID=1076179 RepID=A0A645EL80_9ZZZZ
MFAKDILIAMSSRMSPIFIAIIVILFVVESLYAAYRTLLYFNNYMQNKHKKNKKS